MSSGLTWYCPVCWVEVGAHDDVCARCGEDLRAADRADHESKLIAALQHRLPDRRLLAARVLGQLRSHGAVSALERVARKDPDPYLAAEAVKALARIGSDDAVAVVRDAMRHRSVIVRRAARDSVGPTRP